MVAGILTIRPWLVSLGLLDDVVQKGPPSTEDGGAVDVAMQDIVNDALMQARASDSPVVQIKDTLKPSPPPPPAVVADLKPTLASSSSPPPPVVVKKEPGNPVSPPTLAAAAAMGLHNSGPNSSAAYASGVAAAAAAMAQSMVANQMVHNMVANQQMAQHLASAMAQGTTHMQPTGSTVAAAVAAVAKGTEMAGAGTGKRKSDGLPFDGSKRVKQEPGTRREPAPAPPLWRGK